MKKKILLIPIGCLSIILLIGILVAGSSRVQPAPASENYSPSTVSARPEALDYLTEIGMGLEFGKEEDKVLLKWTKPTVGIKTHGDFNAFLTNCLDQVVKDFNEISQTTKLSMNSSQSDIEIHLAPKEKFSQLISDYVEGNDGFFSLRWDRNHAITSSTVLINSNDPSRDVERCHLIREELTQSMGLGQDSYKYPDSMFYAPWTTTDTYSELDKEIIGLLYNSGLKPGMTEQEVRNYFVVSD